MANELYRTYEVLVEESIHPNHPKRAKDEDGKLLNTKKTSRFDAEIDGALRDTHMIFQDAVCFNTLCFAGLAGRERHKSGERAGEPLNPLWEHLTTPAKHGGINEETARVIHRLAAHYAPLNGVKTADEFLNRAYSDPMQIRDGMSAAGQQAVLDLRTQCYRILEQFGAPMKEKGGQECADMSAFANTWAGLTSKPESDTEIPGNLAYDCICRELKQTLTEELDAAKAVAVLEETLLRYSAKAEERNKADCSLKYAEELEELRAAVAEAEKLAESEPTRATRLKKTKAALERHVISKAKFEQEFFNNRSDGLKSAVKSALAKPFAAGKAEDIGLTEKQFAEGKAYVVSPVVAAKADTKGLIRLHYKGGNPGLFEKAMFRYWLLRDDENELVQRAALADFRKFIKDDKPDDEPKLEDGVHIAEMPFSAKGAKVAFPLFGKKCLGIETIHSSPDWDFDKTAYATAAEDVFKYKIRTAVRKARVKKLLNVVQAYEGNGVQLAPDVSPTGKALTVRGMAGDPRWSCDDEKRKGIVQLLKEMSGDKEIGSYGLRENTIGGWAEVRKALRSCYDGRKKEGMADEDARLVGELEKAVDNEMEANRQGFGSADFFHELCAPEYFHLWLSGATHEQHGVKDYIPHYVSYCEWREELIGLLTKNDGSELERETELSAAEMERLAKKPIRYTWPGLLNRHKKPSYRYYDFTGSLNAAFQFKSLFRRVKAKDASGMETLVEKYKRLTRESAKVTLACRRLKRDKIINKDTGNSVDALWCPPLILAGEKNPTPANHPRAGKYEDAKKKEWPEGDAEASFSLIAQPLPGDYWNELSGVANGGGTAHVAEPTHLTVSFKIEANALAQLQNEGVHFVGGSLKGVEEEDEKRRFFRWPVDIETEKVAAKEAGEKTKRDAEKTGKKAEKPAKKADVAPDKLWCAYADGFQVKEGRYSKAEKTKRVPDIHLLSIDLGNRFAAAFTRLRIHAETNGEGRVVSADGFSPVIKAELVREGTLRLQGEEADIWQLVTAKNRQHIARKLKARKIEREPVVGTYELVDEVYGNQGRGRFPTDKEYADFSALAGRLVAVKSFSLDGTEKQTYPELGDHLVFRLKRRIGRLRTLFNLVGRLCATHERNQRTGKQGKERGADDELFQKRITVETLARSKFPKRPRQPGEEEESGDADLRAALASDAEWQRLKDSNLLDSVKGAAEKKRRENLAAELNSSTAWKWDALSEAVKGQIRDYMEGPDSLAGLLVAVIGFCLPLRGRHWRWTHNPGGERLSWGADNEAPDWTPNVMGMRGLSMKRLEQVLNLRQRCQSFAKLEDRYHGPYKVGNYNPPDSDRDERPDVCPLLLERSNRIREQRVDQAAHLILAETLGMELKNPAEVEKKKERKLEVDLHGEYQRRKDKHGKPFPRCSVIVLENLERYKMSLGRTKAENSRLMKWAHGKILEKLEDMCRPFGITLMLVDPAFTSRFDTRTGLPGVRVNQVSRGFEKEHPYSRWSEGKTKAGGETQLAKDIMALAKTFEEHPKYKGELVLAVEGGKEFVPVLAPAGKDGLINADICAAGNIGLRGIADPQRWDIFPRLRTKQISETEVNVTNWRGWFGKFASNSDDRLMKWSGGSEAGAEGANTPENAPKKRKNAKGASTPGEGSLSAETESQSSQSSEYPPFFIEHPEHDWLPEGDWLKKAAFSFKQADKTVRAFRQGEYLKRVEQVCNERIREINRTRVRKWELGNDDVPM